MAKHGHIGIIGPQLSRKEGVVLGTTPSPPESKITLNQPPHKPFKVQKLIFICDKKIDH